MTDKIPDHVTMAPVVSSQIKSIGYDPQARHLYINFPPGKKNPEGHGSVYRYDGVDAEKHAALLGIADPTTGLKVENHSIGRHFRRHIKSNPDHPYKKLDIEQ